MQDRMTLYEQKVGLIHKNSSTTLCVATRDRGEQSWTKARSIGSSTGATGASNVSSSGKINGPKNHAILKVSGSNVRSQMRTTY